MRNILLILVLFFGIQFKSFSCSCGWGGPFLKVAHDASSVDLVAVVKVKSHLNLRGRYDIKTPMSMEVEVIEVLCGKESKKVIEIWGDSGMMCWPYISEFPEGTTWILALSHGDEQWGHREESKTDYAISVCGEYSLRLKKNSVIGLIEKRKGYYHDKRGDFVKSKDEKMRFKRFKRKFEKMKTNAA